MRLRRNIGIIAHIDAGKTTVSERILHYTGRVHAPGDTHDGNTVLDHDTIEQRKGITINAAATFCEWRHSLTGVHCHINLIDTPGHVDFTAEVERSLRVLDGAVCVLDGKEGVEAQTETVWRQATRYAVPCVVFVNKIDKRGADFGRCLADLELRLRVHPLPLQIPVDTGDDFDGLVDLLEMQAVRFGGEYGASVARSSVPDAMAAEAEAARRALVDRLADLDDAIAGLVLDGRRDDITPEQIRNAVRAATLRRAAVPVLCGSARLYAGVQPLLDAVVDYLPSPEEVPPQRATGVETEEPVEVTPEVATTGLVFKTVSDAYGTLSYVRLFAGELTVGEGLLNARTARRVRVGRMYRMHAQHREPVESAQAGDFVAVVAQGDVRTGDTLTGCDPAIALEPIRFPEPVIVMAVEAALNADAGKLAEALAARERDDPTLRVSTDRATGETLVAGIGELQLEVLRERLQTLHGLQVSFGPPRVAFREAIPADGLATEGLHRKQSGGSGSFGHVKIRWSSLPAEQFDQVEFVDSTRGGVIPKAFIRSVEAGVRAAAATGGLAGFPVGGIRAELYDGTSHDVDGKDFAFADAARLAFKALLEEAGTEILEPVVRVEVRVPDEFTGPVIGDLNARRGRITDVEALEGESVVRAVVPLAEMFGYVGDMRGLTQGRGTYSMEPAGYEQAPQHVKQQIMESRK
ncbi:MAG: elongation factor G [Planctomycetes bacterium]|nr:elongation factor G [Planctomycetota bacterium]